MDMETSKLGLCRIGSDAAKDELEGQRSCRAGQSAVSLAESGTTRLTAGVVGQFAGISGVARWLNNRRAGRRRGCIGDSPARDAPE
jgi:hypothetical protein